MGGQSKSTSSQTTTGPSTDVKDSRVAVEAGGIGVGSGGTGDVTVTDGGIAKDLATASSEIAGAIGGGWDALAGIGQGIADAAVNIVKDNNKILAATKADSGTKIATMTITTVTGGLVLMFIVAVWLISRGKRK